MAKKKKNSPQAICKSGMGIKGKGSMKQLSAAKKRRYKRCEEHVARSLAQRKRKKKSS